MKNIAIFILLTFIGWSNQLNATTKITEQATVQKIFKQLTTTVGDYSAALPKVVIRPQKRYGASYKRSQNTIFIEQAALDICASFGENKESAIAFLLGHELTHYYQKHDWQEAGFTTGFLTSEAVFQKNIQHEKEADTYSAFITHLAGFNSVKILPELLEKIYETYELKGKTLTAYPSLSERKALANNVCKTVQGLIDIYQAANYLYALGKYEKAMVSYEYILKYVKYKELYNNIGLCALYTAIPSVQQTFPFAYPLTLDPTVPLRAPSSFTKEELIQKAINHFSIATNYDNSYFTSYLNLICAYDLNGQYQEVIPLINSIRDLATTLKTKQQLQLIEGISAFRNNNSVLADKYFSAVSKHNEYPDLATIALQNRQISKGATLQRFTNESLLLTEDKIEGINLLFFEKEKKETTYNLRDTPLDKKTIHIQQLPLSKIYLFESNGQVTKMQLTKTSSFKSKQNIGVGSTLHQIEGAYPDLKKRLMPHLKGFYLLIPSKGLFFDMNASKQVVKWGIFID